MILGVPWNEIAWLVLAILIGGVITGILAGLFGIGGGAVIIPVLYELFRILDVSDDVRMQLCVCTSIAIIVPTSIRSYLTLAMPRLRSPCRRLPSVVERPDLLRGFSRWRALKLLEKSIDGRTETICLRVAPTRHAGP